MLLEIIKDYKLKSILKYEHKFNKLKRPIFDYDFLMQLDEKDYPKYLSMAYEVILNQKLNLKNPKTFNEKIQWLKLYDNLPVKTQLTDKVLVRDWVKKEIGENYLKPVLQICGSFDEIDFNKLPDTFIVKCNHGCKWHFVIKDKKGYLANEKAYNLSKYKMNGWISQSFFGYSDFELQYKNIVPKIIIEPLLRENINETPEEIEVYCFNSKPKIIQRRHRKSPEESFVTSFDEKYNLLNLKLFKTDKLINSEVTPILQEAVELSGKLAQNFKFVRVDWMKYKDKLYFAEMTFTPCSGFYEFPAESEEWPLKLGEMLNIKEKKYER